MHGECNTSEAMQDTSRCNDKISHTDTDLGFNWSHAYLLRTMLCIGIFEISELLALWHCSVPFQRQVDIQVPVVYTPKPRTTSSVNLTLCQRLSQVAGIIWGSQSTLCYCLRIIHFVRLGNENSGRESLEEASMVRAALSIGAILQRCKLYACY